MSYITIDIETECTAAGCTGKGCKHALNPATDRITVVALKHPDWEVVTRDLSEVASLIKNQPLVAFNFKFEHLHLNHHGVEVRLDQWVADPFLMAYVSTDKIPSEWLEMYEANRPDGHRKAGKHSLKTLAPYFLKVAPYWEVEQKDDDEYVMTDVRYTEQLHEYFIEHMPHDQFCFYQDKLMAWTKMLVEAEMRGIAIDLDALTAKEQELAARAVELRAKLDEQWRDAHDAYHGEQVTKVMLKYKEQKRNVSWERRQAAAIDKAPRAVDYDSPKQMLWLLQTHLGYDCTSFEGAESTGKEVLQRLSAEHADVAVYLEWRGVNKLLSAFLPTYRELGASGVVRPVFNPGNTRTGRTSSERPNMQQIPEGLRKLFHARPGYQLVGYDMGAIEAKLIAYYTDDETLTSLIKTGVSLHDFNTKTFFNLDCEVSEVASKYGSERKAAKNCGFALFYNAGFNRIKVAFAQKGFHFSDGECKAIHKRFKEAYPQALSYAAQVVNDFEMQVPTKNLLGRPLKIERYEDCYMQAFNMLIQSSASDLLLDSALNAQNVMRYADIEAHPLLFVHDFVCFEVEESRAEEASRILRTAMTRYDLNGIPLTVDGGISERWEK